MGKYTVSGKCSGDVDDEEYRGLKSRGFTLELELKKDGTGIETRTGPDAGIENFTWSQLGQTLCIKNACVPYELAANEQTFRINLKEDAYCIDEDYNITGLTLGEHPMSLIRKKSKAFKMCKRNSDLEYLNLKQEIP